LQVRPELRVPSQQVALIVWLPFLASSTYFRVASKEEVAECRA